MSKFITHPATIVQGQKFKCLRETRPKNRQLPLAEIRRRQELKKLKKKRQKGL